MSVRVTSEVWRLRMPSTDKLVLVCIADHAKDDGSAFPGVARLAERCGLTARCVTATLRRLEAVGVLQVVAIERGTRSRRYALTPERHSPLTPEPRSPRTTFTPEPRSATPEPRSATPEPRSPESSGTIKNRQKRKIRARATKRCPPDFALTPALVAFAVGKGVPAAEVDDQLAAFRDCEFAKAHTDWPATWRTWCRNYRKFNPQPRQASGFARPLRRDEITANAIAKLRSMGHGTYDGPEMAGGNIHGGTDLVTLPGRLGRGAH